MASRTLINQLTRVFSSSITEGESTFPYSRLVDTNRLFDTFLSIGIKIGEVEVPAYLRYNFANYIDSIRNKKSLLERNGLSNLFKQPGAFIVPLYSVNTSIVKKTGDSILSYIFSAKMRDKLLSFQIPGDNSKYYGTRGLLLNSKKEVLMIATVKFTIFDDYSYACRENTISINPNVFVNKDLVSKTILGKVIPLYIENKDLVSAKFLIEDKSFFISKPKAPNYTDYQDEINLILKDNIEFITSDFIYSELL